MSQTTFTDATLTEGPTGSVIRNYHVSELRTAVNNIEGGINQTVGSQVSQVVRKDPASGYNVIQATADHIPAIIKQANVATPLAKLLQLQDKTGVELQYIDVNGLYSLATNSNQLGGQSGSYYLSRTNHTGSQTRSTISDFAHKDTHKTGGADALTLTDLLDCIARLGIRINTGGALTGQRREINVIGSGSTSVSATDDAVNERVNVTISSGATGFTSNCLVGLATNQSILTSTWAKVQASTKVFDTSNEYDNVTNFRFTALSAGKYLIIGVIDMQDAPLIPQKGTALYLNGVVNKRVWNSKDVAGETGNMVSVVLNLAANDFIEFFGFQNSGSTMQITGSMDITYLSIHRLS